MIKILFVEDNDLNADMLGRRLTKCGYQAVRAADGRQAITLAVRERPDLILMDLSLPEIDGWDATREVKCILETAHIPVIALTARVMENDRARAFAAGCEAFETKPIDFDRLLQKMQQLLASRRRTATPPPILKR